MTGWLELALPAAFLTGLTGGVHCAAMCGPLVGIACGSHQRSGREAPALLRALAYNGGRIATYVFAGAMTGALGAAGLGLRGDPIVHQTLLAVMSMSLILLAGCIAGITPLRRVLEAAGGVIWRRVEPHARRFLPATTPGRAFGLGLVWGWLPCGMVYVVLISAAASADPAHGALTMAAFGLGTLPNLLAISACFGQLRRLVRGRLVRVLAATVIAVAGVTGLARAAHPALPSVDGWLCPELPGLTTVLTGGSPHGSR
jgi:sulfite exporter TauE/SafE